MSECMYRDPVFIEDLLGLLNRFRTYKIALIGEIKTASLQIALQETERHVTRFLRLNDPTKSVSEDKV